VALTTTCIKNVKLKIIKIKTGCQFIGKFYYSENLNWAAQNLRLGRGLDMVAIDKRQQKERNSTLAGFADKTWVILTQFDDKPASFQK